MLEILARKFLALKYKAETAGFDLTVLKEIDICRLSELTGDKVLATVPLLTNLESDFTLLKEI